MLPYERREPVEEMGRNGFTAGANGINDAAHIECVPVDDGSDDEIDAGSEASSTHPDAWPPVSPAARATGVWEDELDAAVHLASVRIVAAVSLEVGRDRFLLA